MNDPMITGTEPLANGTTTTEDQGDDNDFPWDLLGLLGLAGLFGLKRRDRDHGYTGTGTTNW